MRAVKRAMRRQGESTERLYFRLKNEADLTGLRALQEPLCSGKTSVNTIRINGSLLRRLQSTPQQGNASLNTLRSSIRFPIQ
jgi:hypothetical protein